MRNLNNPRFVEVVMVDSDEEYPIIMVDSVPINKTVEETAKDIASMFGYELYTFREITYEEMIESLDN